MSVKSMLPFAAAILGTLPLSAAPNSCRPVRSFEQGHELRQSQMMAAYNAPARIDVRGSWDVSFDGSYIYWQPREENLELGISNTSSATALPINGNVVNTNFKYKSGFKVGMGLQCDRDNWDASAEFTWLSGRHTATSNGPAGGGLIPIQGHPSNIPTVVNSGKSRWRLNFKTVDLDLARSYYVGTKLTFRPYFGGRLALINQKYVGSYVNGELPAGPVPYEIRNTSTSWGLGPQVGLDANWMLGYGIRIIGSAETDVLFTRYNLRYKEENSANPTQLVVNLRQNHLYYLRPHVDLEMGFGWGTYLGNHNYHIDLLASYGFQVFWNQNMFRNFVDATSPGKSIGTNGDLYMHGLTTTFSIDF